MNHPRTPSSTEDSIQVPNTAIRQYSGHLPRLAVALGYHQPRMNPCKTLVLLLGDIYCIGLGILRQIHRLCRAY